MKFCSDCGSSVSLRIPSGDTLPRYICDSCGHIFYKNPKVVVGTLPRWADQVLLCRRAIEPRYGYWTLPSGYLEEGESVEEGAIRETVEEAGAQISIARLFSVFSLPHVSQLYLIFLADLESLEFDPGEESLEVRLMSRDEIPWPDIAFRAIEFSLERYFENRTSPDCKVHMGCYSRRKNGRWIRAAKPG